METKIMFPEEKTIPEKIIILVRIETEITSINPHTHTHTKEVTNNNTSNYLSSSSFMKETNLFINFTAFSPVGFNKWNT